jgi:acetate kinase
LRLVTLHLGNGASAAAIQRGASLDTSMGFTPLAGLTMGTRSGDIDVSLVAYLANKTHQSFADMVQILNDKSGMLGLTGLSSDFRDIDAAAQAGNERAILGEKVFINRVVKYIGAYTAEMGGLDAIVFTGGVGEHRGSLRHGVLQQLAYMGIVEDPAQVNAQATAFLTTPASAVQALVVTTNEEVMIARSVMQVTAH